MADLLSVSQRAVDAITLDRGDEAVRIEEAPISSVTFIRRNKILRLRWVRRAGRSRYTQGREPKPFASQLPPLACTPIVPRLM